MEVLPIYIKVKPYLGPDKMKRFEYGENLRLSKRITGYINEKMIGKEKEVFNISYLGAELGVSSSQIKEVIKYLKYEGSALHVCTKEYYDRLSEQ